MESEETTITNVALVFITQGKIGKNKQTKQEKKSYPKKNWNKRTFAMLLYPSHPIKCIILFIFLNCEHSKEKYIRPLNSDELF